MKVIKKGCEIKLPSGEKVTLTKVSRSLKRIGVLDINKKIGDKTAAKPFFNLHYKLNNNKEVIEVTIPSNQVEIG